MEQAGIRLVLEGLPEFLQGINDANAAVKTFTSQAQQISAQTREAAASVTNTSAAVQTLTSATQGATAAQSQYTVNGMAAAEVEKQLAAQTREYAVNQERAAEVLAQFSNQTQQTAQETTVLSSSMGQSATAADSLGTTITGLSAGAQQLTKDWMLYRASEPQLNVDQWNRLASAVGQMDRLAPEFVGNFNTMVAALEAENKALAQTSIESEKAAAAVQLLATEMIALGTAGTVAAIGMATTASRIEELEVILEVTRQNAIDLALADGDLARASALTATAVQAQVQGIRDLHLSGIVANETVAQLIRYNLDWTKSTELAALAQNSAVFAMQDSSQALQGIIRGITTLQTRSLRTYGIMINLNAAYADFAKANDLYADTLTESQKQQAALNAVLAQAPAVQGAYTAAMGTAAKQLRSLKTDTINLAEAYGEYLTPVLDLGVGAFRSVLKILTDLPDPMQAFVVYAGASASTMALVTGSALKLLPRLTALKDAFLALSVSSKALLGLGGIASILIGLAAAAIAADKAHRAEAASIAVTAETYPDYIRSLEIAERSSYALTEQLWEQVKAQDAVNQQAYQERLQDAQKALEAYIGRLVEANRGLAGVETYILKNVDAFDEFSLAVLASEEAMYKLAVLFGAAPTDARAFAQAVVEIAEAEIKAREETEEFAAKVGELTDWWDRHGTKVPTYIKDEAAAMTRLTTEMDNYSEAVQQAMQSDEVWYRAATDARVNLLGYQEAVTNAVEDSAWKQLEAMQERTRAFEDLDRDYASKSRDVWQEYRNTITEIDRDIVAFHAGTLDELLDLDRETGQKRADIQRDYLQAIEDAERDFAQDLVDLAADRIQKLEDLERDYAQDRENILRDLARDLEDIERDHLDTMRGLEADYYADLAELAEEYGDRLASITERYEQERRAIEEKYRVTEPPSVPDIDEQREDLLRQLRELLGLEDAYTKQGYRGVWEERKAELERQLEALKQIELAELEARKRAELAELEAWLAEEEAKREEAYQKARNEEERRFQQRKADREREAQQRLEDLERQHQQERDEIERDYQRRLADLQAHHQRERDEIDRNNQRKLEDMNTQYAREKALILEKLEDQRAAAKEKLDEGLADLKQWYADQKVLIEQNYQDQRDEIVRQLQLTVLKAAEEFGMMPEAFQPVWDELIRQGQEQAANLVDGIIDEFQRLFEFFQIGSPSRLMEEFARDVISPLKSVWGNVSASDLLGDALGAEAFQANINAALGNFDLSGVLPAQQAFVPGMSTGNRSSTVNNNLSVTAQYGRVQKETSLRDDMQMLSMMMNAVPRR